VALAASRYSVTIGGSSYLLSGTSASAPVVAAFVSLANAQRHKNGLGPVGYINEGILY
jgi:subtilase family serine protease